APAVFSSLLTITSLDDFTKHIVITIAFLLALSYTEASEIYLDGGRERRSSRSVSACRDRLEYFQNRAI
ncbi:uncharacterized, partial [Tachysurus ichikawai]